jgi:signal transduction histidine kinase
MQPGGTLPSLQGSLNRWILSATVVFALVAGMVSGWVAFDEASELQDNQLQQIAQLAVARTARVPVMNDDSDPEDTLILQRLGESSPNGLPIPSSTPDGLHTLEMQGKSWRVFIYNGQFAVSQQTEVRDEIAWDSSLRTLLPVLLLAPILMAVISFAVNRSLKPVHALAEMVDKRDESRLDALPDRGIPEEILPFSTSINRLLARLRQAIAQQQRFVADAAHELRTPVTAISLLTENLANATTLDESRERLMPVQEGLERMRTLVAHLLDLARVQGENQAAMQPVDFQQVVQEAIGDLYPLAEAKSIDLGMLHSEPVTLPDVAGNLSVLVRNALENAIRYTPEDGQVDVSLYTENGQAVLLVEDTGCGIPDTELQQVFEPFYRVGVSTEPGNGLGLAISQEIAKRLGGNITLNNRPQGGLTFCYRQLLV